MYYNRKEGRVMGEVSQEKNRKIRNDILLISGILAGIGIIFLIIRFVFCQEGTKAVVMIDDTVILEQELSMDCQVPIQTQEGYNVFQIKDGVVTVQDADCRDQICVEHIGICKKGETIVCLPHHFVIEIQ